MDNSTTFQGNGEVAYIPVVVNGKQTRQTNADKIRAMSDEQLAEYLFVRGNGCEYCYGICAYQDECDGTHAQEFCIQQIISWLNKESNI